jgi:hypothetical protein
VRDGEFLGFVTVNKDSYVDVSMATMSRLRSLKYSVSSDSSLLRKEGGLGGGSVIVVRINGEKTYSCDLSCNDDKDILFTL